MGMLTDETPSHRDSLEQYFADDAATDALALADSDPEAAKSVLLIASGYIRRGEALPGNLAEYLVEAIETAMAKPQKLRAKALTDELMLTANNRRPAGDWARTGGEVERRVNAGESPEKAILDLSLDTGISDRTIKRYWDKYKTLAAQLDADMKKGQSR
jgi:hypothetical protein